MPATEYLAWMEQSSRDNPLYKHAIEQGWRPGPKNVEWSASVVCEPPQFVDNKGMFTVYRDWIKRNDFTAQYEHSTCTWYFEREDEALLFTITFG
jgi:hypothetical protein